MPERTDGLCAGEEKAYHDFAVSNGRSLLYSYSISSASSYASVSTMQGITYKRIEVGDTIDVSSWFTAVGGTASNIRVIDTRLATVSGTMLTAVDWGRTQIICDNGNFRVIALEIRPKGAVAMPMVYSVLEHTVALKADGTVWAWGSGARGALGQGNNSKGEPITTSYRYPVPVLCGDSVSANGYLSNMIEVAAGNDFCLALRNDGTLWGWGYGGNGRLGNGLTSNTGLPVRAASYASGIVHIAAEQPRGYYINANGDGYAWGWRYFGGIGDGQSGDSSQTTPARISLYRPIVDIRAARQGNIALDVYGQVWNWGRSLSPSIHGISDGKSSSPSPKQVKANSGSYLSRIVEVEAIGDNQAEAAGNMSYFALNADGRLYRWGRSEGIYGDTSPSTNSPNYPVVYGLANIIHIDAASYKNSFKTVSAMTRDGQIYVLGDGYHGQIGNGSWYDQTYFTPTAISRDVNYYTGAAGGANYLAVKTNGSVWGWGWNNTGQLGDGTASERNVPVRAGGDYPISSIIRVTAANINNDTTGKPVASYTEANPMPTTITLGEDETLFFYASGRALCGGGEGLSRLCRIQRTFFALFLFYLLCFFLCFGIAYPKQYL